MRNLRTSLAAAIGLLILILDTKTALLGASSGIELCIRTVIPSLLPFFVLSVLLTSSLSGKSIACLNPLRRLCGIPKGAESLLLVGILGGYPSGAQCVAQAYQDSALCKMDAQRMIAFCNLAGPAFLFGIVSTKFNNPSVAWVLWVIHITSAIFVAVVLPERSREITALRSGKPLTISQALSRSLRIMAGVCGWIILLRILITFLDRWLLWLFPPAVQVAITGILELSNGCCDLGKISCESLRFIICSGMLAFGGLCVTMQTASVTEGLSMRYYICGKFLQTAFSILFSSLLQFAMFSQAERTNISLLSWLLTIASTVAVGKFLHKTQKRSSISLPVGV